MKEHPESVYCLPVRTIPPWEPDKELKIRSMVQNCQTSREFHDLCTCRGYRSLREMLNCFEVFLPLVRGNLELIEQLAYDFCQRQWEQNVVYTEVRYSPHLLAEGFAVDVADSSTNDDSSEHPAGAMIKVTPESVFEAVTKGLRRGCEKFDNLIVNQILCGIAWRPDWAMSTLDMVAKHRNDYPCAVVGVDIAAGEEHFDEQNHPDLYGPHYEMAQEAKKNHIPLTLHAGEATEHALENIRRAITEYGARRIGHGYRMVESLAIMELVRDNNVHVEVCPTSSVETGGWVYDNDGTRDWREHPAMIMMKHGVSVSLSSDDPAVFHTSLAWQYRVALSKMKLTRQDLVEMNIGAVEAAWCSSEEKTRLRKLIQCYGKERNVEGLEHYQCDDDQAPRSWGRSKTDSFSDRVYLNLIDYV
jgi:adenosine deaminase